MTAEASETLSIRVRLARLLATAGGLGYAPVAPGTVGTAAAIPLAWLLAGVPTFHYVALVTALVAASIWAAHQADRSWGTHDSGRIVIDEVAGYLLTVVAVDRSSVILLLAGFVVFRAFDIAKPPPVRWIDRRLAGGYGVILDDVAAGLLGAPILWAMALTGLHQHLAGW